MITSEITPLIPINSPRVFELRTERCRQSAVRDNTYISILTGYFFIYEQVTFRSHSRARVSDRRATDDGVDGGSPFPSGSTPTEGKTATLLSREKTRYRNKRIGHHLSKRIPLRARSSNLLFLSHAALHGWLSGARFSQ
ncbi:hypothetical protein PUN28_015369 [Cardiocondyla obscurior]|uniref:Uncharacterized protein n=1 Tax=Cardiocondyla obscurior TaxID=286306 RepID=A0AAW2EYM9_9HYME